MEPREAITIACRLAKIKPDELRNSVNRDRAVTAARRGVILGLRDRRVPYSKIADVLCLESAESARTICSVARNSMRPNTLADTIWTAVMNAEMPPGEDDPNVPIMYQRGSIVPVRGYDESLIGRARTRGTVVTSSGSTFVRDPQTGDLKWKQKKEGKIFRRRGGLS